jgi:hypothetical protein
MARSGDGNDVSGGGDQDEANIRWLLAAVLHHQPEDELPDAED